MRVVLLLGLIYRVLSLPVGDEALEEFIKGNHKFTAAVYKEVLKNEKGNFVASPFSVETVLAFTGEGAKGATATELITGLSLPKSKENIQSVFKSFSRKLKKSDQDLKLLSANKIYVKPGLKLEESFSSTAADIYDSGVSSVDFSNNIEAAGTINNWVEDNTDHKIKNLIKPDDIDKDTSVILVNALYFSGKWVSNFDSYATYRRKFFKNKDENAEVDFMYQTEFQNYYEDETLNATFLQLPYRGDNISMTIVLPNEIEGLAKLEENLEQLIATQSFTRALVAVSLPKFTIETDIKFKPILQNLGVRKLFNNEANLTGISSSYKNLLVSDVVQKAFINVTEDGTEAAAATGVILVPLSGSPLPDYRFEADHPFLYFIKHNEVVLFVGRYTTPS